VTIFVTDRLILKAGFNPAELRSPLGTWTTSAAQSSAATQAGAKTKPGGSNPKTPAAVKKLQVALGVKQTGVYDAATKSAVTEFQKRYHLLVDGIAGNQTMAALRAALGGKKGALKAKQKTAAKKKTAAKPQAKKTQAPPAPVKKFWIKDGDIIKAGVCTEPGICDTSPIGHGGHNWVTRAGGLPDYVRAVAHALMRKGMPESKAIAIAVSQMKKGFGPKSKPQTKAHAAAAAAEWEAKKGKAHLTKITSEITKIDEDERTVFGWAYITHDELGTLNVDKSGEFIDDPAELASAAYDFVLESRKGGRDHQRAEFGPVVKSTMIESMVFTPEKLEAMGVPNGVLPIGWWTGWKVHDDQAWLDVKEGRAKSFSIHGTGSKMAA